MIAQYESTGNCSADMVLNCIDHYRRYEKPIKEIWLKSRNFIEFRDYILNKEEDKSKQDDILNPNVCFMVDGVDVKMTTSSGNLSAYLKNDPLFATFYDDGRAKEIV